MKNVRIPLIGKVPTLPSDARTVEFSAILRELHLLAERAESVGAPATAKEIRSATLAALLEGAKEIPDGDPPPRLSLPLSRRAPPDRR